jgi:hypothetical protein
MIHNVVRNQKKLKLNEIFEDTYDEEIKDSDKKN